MYRRNAEYRKLFFRHRGIRGPWLCWFCVKPVHVHEFQIHHIDHDWQNNVIDNLAPAHRGCHVGYHNACG